MARAVFINPSWDQYISKRGKRHNRYWPPLDLLNCAGMLERNGIECDIYDQRIEGETQVPVENYDFVFVTSSFPGRFVDDKVEDIRLGCKVTLRFSPSQLSNPQPLTQMAHGV